MQNNPENFTGTGATGRNNDMDSTLDINSDENAAGLGNLGGEGVDPEGEIEKLSNEIQEQKDKYLRLFAEFDNYRRRTSREYVDLTKTAGKEVIVSLLDVLDDCDRAEKELQKSTDSDHTRAGVLLVFNKLRSALQSRGLKAMESIGTEFDVEKHEAITEIPAPTAAGQGKVLDEVTRGYYLNDKLIRFAKVIVGK